MKKISEKSILKVIISLFILLIIISFLRYPDSRNEMKYFVVISEMLEKKDMFILTYLGELYPDKPPMYFWILAILKNSFDKSFYSVALIVTGVIPLIFTAKMVYSLFKEKLTVLIYISMVFVLGCSLVLRMDTLMTMFIVSSIVYFYKLYTDRNKGNALNKNHMIIVYLSMAAAILVKGGAGIVIPLLTIICFLYLNNDFKFLKKIKFGQGILLVLGIVVLWLLAVFFEEKGKEYISLMLGQQTVGRVVNSGSHKRPLYFYMKNIFLTTMPFGIVFATGLFLYIKDFKNRFKWTQIEKLCISWIIPSIIFFSLVSGKLDIYLLPTYPGIAGLIWCFYNRKEWEKYFVKASQITMVIFSAASLVAGIVIFIKLRELYIFGIIFIALSLSLIYLLKMFSKYGDKKNLIAILGGIILFLMGGIALEANSYDNNYTLKPLETVLEQGTKGEEILLYRFEDTKNLLYFYDISYKSESDFNDIMGHIEKSENSNVKILSKTKRLKEIKEKLKDYKYIVLKENKEFVLVEVSK